MAALFDHEHLQGRQEAVLAVSISMIVLSSLFVFLRILSRSLIVKKVQIDDYFMILGWVISFALSFCVCYGCSWGLGRHEWNIPETWHSPLRKLNYSFSVLYQPALMAIKTSILAFYLSLPTQNKTFKWACIGTLFVVNAGGFSLLMFTLFQCSPVGAAFAFPIPLGSKCTDVVTIYLSSAPLNIITDLAILFLPMPILTAMRLPRKQKIILVITFGFGAFVAAVDVVRIVYLQSAAMTRLEEIHRDADAADDSSNARRREYVDFSYYASLSFMWSVVEVNVGIMCACVPGLKPLASKFLPKMLRDASDPVTRTDSVIQKEMAEVQRVPSMMPMPPEEVHRHDFGSTSGPAGQEPHEDDTPIGFLDMLAMPEDNDFPPAERTQTALTNTSRNTTPASPTFFDFVNMKRKKSMVHMTNRESVFPIAMVTILFFIWGFEYGLLDGLNQQFQRVASMSTTQGTAIHSAYFTGYFFGPLLIGRLVLKHWGFKACYAVGLSIYACGTLIFWPAAVLTSFPAFVITNFIVAFGLSILEVAANPFIVLCGPPQYGEIRINISQGFQAIGSVVAPLIANKAFWRSNLDAPSLVDVQWAYLGIALFTVLLAVAYYYVPLPEATDEELEDASERIDSANKAKMGNVNIIWITLAVACFSQFCYCGGQEINATMFDTYTARIGPTFNVANRFAIAHTAFALSRFMAAGLGFWIKPRFLLLGFYIMAIVFEALAMQYTGSIGNAMMTMVFFSEGPIFGLIFAQAMRGMGKHTKNASVLMTSSIVGGAVFPPITDQIGTVNGRVMYSLVVAVAVFAFGTLFPLELSLNPLSRRQCDPIKDQTVSPPESRSSSSSRASRALSFLHIGKKQNREPSVAEHNEGEERPRRDSPDLQDPSGFLS